MAASDLRFSGLTLTTGGRSPKALLQGISGCCDGGTITAVVGPSGAGKSLLLDVLAGQPPVGCAVGGSIQLDGTPLSPAVMQERACLVLQNDVLLATATVREMVTHSALLRLPADMPREAKLERVEAILQELDLAGCADSLIGDSERGRQRLSGGQRRRTTLAIELVRLPCLLLLDEPLSGLDSEMALSVIQGLSHLTAQGRIVLLSVHQASPTLERKFQQLLVMASGRLVCAGTHSQALECIEQAGLSCPAYESPVDFLVAAVKVPEQQDALVAAFEGLRDGWGVEGCNSGTPHGKLIGSCGTPAVSTGSVGDEEQGRQHSAAGNTKGGDALGKTGAWHVLTHFSATTCLLSKRHMLSALRKPKALAMEVLRKIVVFAFLGESPMLFSQFQFHRGTPLQVAMSLCYGGASPLSPHTGCLLHRAQAKSPCMSGLQ